ncbi:hypothetical protein ESA_01667 [Cronobacter sakazakii ATCC BAA-894]|uniref:Uncharacterized protein n=1 Tax=Cronobacter sakazakii (strain ATCC BAA-894) TaxID=290339 RepID=A7MGH1_CROS8|nr:hypothetical protein ESA_01667 [Cronobacter sakazakii ATCC BAA-894]
MDGEERYAAWNTHAGAGLYGLAADFYPFLQNRHARGLRLVDGAVTDAAGPEYHRLVVFCLYEVASAPLFLSLTAAVVVSVCWRFREAAPV